MSLPNNLAKIKSSGIYRYVYDKSQVPDQVGETLRLVVGFSEKGPFNTPVYVNNRAEFINIFGNVSKRLEKKGIFFHRMALQALAAGPILAFNMKPFDAEHISGVGLDPVDVVPAVSDPEVALKPKTDIDIKSIFNTERFWKLDEDKVPKAVTGGKYINIAATDTKNTSCSLFIRPMSPEDKKQYDIKTGDWYKNVANEELPEGFDGSENLSDYFAEIYVFKGKFDTALCTGALKDYFDQVSEGVYKLKASYSNKFKEALDTLQVLSEDPRSKFIGRYQGSLIPYFKDANGNYISLDIVFNSDYNNHKMIMKLDEDKFGADKTFSAIGDADWKNNWPALIPTYIEGYTYTVKSQNDIFAVLDDKGIYTALTNRVDSDYHYIVDTFASIKLDTNKAKLSAIAKAKDNAFAILNFPAMSQFDNITDAAAWVGKPSEVNGASYCALYTPLVFSDGTVKTVVPSAALVSNNFMEKYNSRQPYYIVAGPTYGTMAYEGLVGPDYNFGRSDLDILEPAGINAMVFVPRKGTYINSNQTAKQTPVTALSKIHVRELVIFLQDEIESMLQNYQWELNTNVLRDNIKAKADTICEKCANNGGIYAYQNICDESNNTPEVIDNEMIVLDTAIEPARGTGKMVQQLTIHKTGGISTLLK